MGASFVFHAAPWAWLFSVPQVKEEDMGDTISFVFLSLVAGTAGILI